MSGSFLITLAFLLASRQAECLELLLLQRDPSESFGLCRVRGLIPSSPLSLQKCLCVPIFFRQELAGRGSQKFAKPVGREGERHTSSSAALLIP